MTLPSLGWALLLVLGRAATAVRAGDSCASIATRDIPSCAQPCFVDGAASVRCDLADYRCQCQQQARLFAAVEDCVSAGCPSASYQAVIDGASSVCDCATGGAGGIVGSMSVAPSSIVASLPPPAAASFSPTVTAAPGGSPAPYTHHSPAPSTSAPRTSAPATSQAIPSSTAPVPAGSSRVAGSQRGVAAAVASALLFALFLL